MNLKSARPPVGNIDPSVDNITFQQIDMDYYVGELRLLHSVG